MQALRSALRRQLPVRRPALAIYRQQTGGPHKEYFQNPTQSPIPDISPYNPVEPIETFPAAESSWTIRALRSVLWATLFGVVGAGAGVGLITWEYLQPPFEPGSPEDIELFEEIAETLNSHPVAEDLRNDGWIEEDFYTLRSPPNQGLHLVYENLTGTRGLTIKAFCHPTMQYTILLVFVGFSVEGWPDVLHGGVTASLMLEGAQRHLNTYYTPPSEGQLAIDSNSKPWHINVDYKKPLRPGEIYAVVVPPAGIELQSSDATGTNSLYRFITLVMRLEAAPRLGSEYDPVTNTQNHTMEIASSGARDVTYAMGTIEIPVVEGPAPTEPIQPDTAQTFLSALSPSGGTDKK